MSPAQRFLESLQQARLNGEALLPFAVDVDGYEAASDAAPEAIEKFICEVGSSSIGTVADVQRNVFASACANAAGELVIGDERFRSWLADEDLQNRLISRPIGNGPQIMVVASSISGRPVAVASARKSATNRWPLDDKIIEALEAGHATHALLAFTPRTDSWAAVATTLALTPSEMRLLAALATSGDLQAASKALGIAYDTGRKLIASAMRKTGSSRQTELVRLALKLVAGSIVAPPSVDGVFAELFGVSLRRAQVARRIANGDTRESAAASLGISRSSAKADLKAVYSACDVTSAVELSRLIAEVDALSGLAEACDIQFNFGGTASDPLRLLRRNGRAGYIAFADHGPAAGYPVFIFHTTTGGRAQSPRLLSDLAANGYRPIILDRPGYGLTDMAAGHIWDAAASDVADVMDELSMTEAVILSRGGAQPAVVTAARLGQKIRGVVLIGPDAPVHLDKSRSGMMGRAKNMIYSSPRMLEALSILLSRQTSSSAIERMMRSSVLGSDIDLAVCDDPAEMAALVRGGRQSAQGRVGFVAEHSALSRGDPLPKIADANSWTVLFGADDPLYGFQDTETYWSNQLDGSAKEIVVNGGRFLQATHTNRVVAALNRARFP